MLSFHDNGYIVDGKPSPTYDPDIVELAVIDVQVPEYNTETHSVGSDYVLDVEAKTYTQVWSITPKTPYEIAMEGWEHPQFAKKIIAPMQLVMEDIGSKMYNWFSINDFPIVKKEPFVHVYCITVLPEHQAVIDAFAGFITIEDRPTE